MIPIPEEMTVQVLFDEWGIEALSVTPLDGYDNLNFKVEAAGKRFFVIKIYPGEKDIDILQSESRVLEMLGGSLPGKFPLPVKTRNGKYLAIRDATLFRVLTWLDGEFLAHTNPDEAVLSSFGRFMGELNVALTGIKDPVIASRRIPWDLQQFMSLNHLVPSIPDAEIRKLADHFILRFRDQVAPELPHLRRSIIHNDANNRNVLVNNGSVTGLIDFGDMVEAPVIQEIAVALAYVMMNSDDPLGTAVPFVRAYQEVLPLQEKEIDLLYDLIANRLVLSLLHSYPAMKQGIPDDYRLISLQPAMALLRQWIAISPLKVARTFRSALGMDIPAEVDYPGEMARRNRHIGKSLSVSYRKPVKMEQAVFQYMFDADGNTFLDAYNNIPHVGHQHPRVVDAARRQMSLLNTNTRYLYDMLADYAERLLAKFPKPLNKVFFVNSGSEASDLAIRIAQTVTGNRRVVVLEYGYHGNTRMGINVSHYKFSGKGGAGASDFITVLPIPDTCRGQYRDDDGTAGQWYARDAIRLLDQGGQKLSAFIAEPLVGCGGQVPLAQGYLQAVYPEIRRRGGLCISDEVQTGFGRLGCHFWGFELHGVIPDLVVLGKPMGNGHPLGAVVTTDAIADAFANGMEFFSSFGGNPVSCATGMAVLEVIEAEDLQRHAWHTGNYFMEQLRDLQKEFSQVGDVRGSGLFIGADLVKDPVSREPDTGLAQHLKNKLRENFILVSTDGPHDNVIKMKPPMCFNRDNAGQVTDAFRAALIAWPARPNDSGL